MATGAYALLPAVATAKFFFKTFSTQEVTVSAVPTKHSLTENIYTSIFCTWKYWEFRCSQQQCPRTSVRRILFNLLFLLCSRCTPRTSTPLISLFWQKSTKWDMGDCITTLSFVLAWLAVITTIVMAFSPTTPFQMHHCLFLKNDGNRKEVCVVSYSGWFCCNYPHHRLELGTWHSML